MFTSIYIYHISYHRYVCISTLAVHSHTCLCPCERSHLEPLCIHTFFRSISHYIDRIMDSFVYEPILQENTYVCAFASAHTYNLFVYMHILTSTRMLYHKYFVYDPDVVQTYVYLCPFESSRLEPHVSIHIFTSIHVSFFDTLVYEPKYCNSHLFVPLLVLTLESSLYTCIYIYSQVNIYHVIYIYMCLKKNMLCELTYVSSLARAHT